MRACEVGASIHARATLKVEGVHFWSPMVKFEIFWKNALQGIQTIQGGSRLRFVPTWEATLALEGYTFLVS